MHTPRSLTLQGRDTYMHTPRSLTLQGRELLSGKGQATF